ncbi:MAG TPA: ROK family protein [Terriglobales bacterium]|nr:ROK family protein [Terriglobales bacterium]
MSGRRRVALGIDLGGTTFKVAVVEPDGRVLASRVEATPIGLAPAATVKTVMAAARAVVAGLALEPRALSGIGLGVPGALDVERGVVRSSPNLPGWHDVPVAALAADAIDAPVAVEHDVRLAALAEARAGAGHGVARFVCVTVGTGIGAAIVLDGRLYRGASDAAGEIGHVRVRDSGAPCGCGRHGCLETVGSGRAVAEAGRRRAVAGAAPALLASAGGAPDAISAQDVFTLAAQGDAACTAIVDEAAAALADGLVVLVNVLNPDVIALGGGLGESGAVLLDRVRAGVRAAAWKPGAEVVRIVPAALGARAGAIGAALHAAALGSRC